MDNALLELATQADIASAVNVDGSPVSCDVVITARLFNCEYDKVTDSQHVRAIRLRWSGHVRLQDNLLNVRRWPDIGEQPEDGSIHSGSRFGVGGVDYSDLEARIIDWYLREKEFRKQQAKASAAASEYAAPKVDKKAGGKKHYSKRRRHETWYKGKEHG